MVIFKLEIPMIVTIYIGIYLFKTIWKNIFMGANIYNINGYNIRISIHWFRKSRSLHSILALNGQRIIITIELNDLDFLLCIYCDLTH